MVKQTNQTGFALLITLIVVGVILSIGLSVLDLSIKQVKLSTNAKDSEIAFHAANAGVECARYWRRQDAANMESGINIDPSCFGVSSVPGIVVKNIDHGGLAKAPSINSGDGVAFFYAYRFQWGPSESWCTFVNTLVSSSSPSDTDPLVILNADMQALFPGYPSGDLSCEVGSKCTVISVQGYNKNCDAVLDASNNYGIVQREVLLQY